MLQIINSITNEKYYKLLDFLITKCDVLTFQIPNQFQIYLTERNIEFFPEYDLNSFVAEEDCEEYTNYKKNIEHRLKYFRKYFLNEYIDVGYAGSIYGNKTEIKIISYDENVLGVLKSTEGLYDWQYPNMPEDLCFFSKGKCFLKSVAHEKLCFIYDESKETIRELKKIGFKLIKTPNETVPEIKSDIMI